MENWDPLDVLRKAALVNQEQRNARGLWDDFMNKMSTSVLPEVMRGFERGFFQERTALGADEVTPEALDGRISCPPGH